MLKRGRNAALTFSNDVGKVVRKYVIVPVLVAYFVILAVIVLFYALSIGFTAKDECSSAASRFEGVVSAYEKRLGEIVEDSSLESLIRGDIYVNAFSEAVYDFINTQEIQAHFFLLDASGSLVLGSSMILSNYLTATPPYNTGLMYRLQNNVGSPSKMLSQVGNARASSMVLSIGQAIVRDETIVGYFVFELSPSQILEYISTGEMGDVVVTNSFFTTLVTSKNEYIDQYSKLKSEYRGKTGLVKIGAQRFYIASEFIADMDSWVFIFIKAGTLTKSILITSLVAGAVLVASVFAIGGMSGRVLDEEASSIDGLIASIKRMKEKGIYAELEPVGSKFSSLEASYGELLQDIRDLAQANRQEASMRERAELKQLESQFNPHFIFNTLEIIRCYIKLDPAAANRMILDFSSLLRYSIDSSVQYVPLRDDLNYIECYLSMNRMSHPNGLSYSIEATDEALAVPVPKLCIQPLVENAVKYGVSKSGVVSCIVRAHVEEGNLKVVVSDGGCGIDDHKLADILETLECEETPSKYFGLYNVHRRLRLLYGRYAGLSLKSGPAGTSVTLSIPVSSTTVSVASSDVASVAASMTTSMAASSKGSASGSVEALSNGGLYV